MRGCVVGAVGSGSPVTVPGLLRAGYGTLVVLWPGQVVAAYSGKPPRPVDVRVARVLGARHLVQAIACAGTPTRPVLLLGVETDMLHAASALLLSVADRPRRRTGLVDAAVATLFAAAGAVASHRAPVRVQGRGPGRGAPVLARVRDRVGSALAARAVPARALRTSAPGA